MSDSRRLMGNEPTLDDLMADPIMARLLKSDRLEPEDTWEAISAARRRIAALKRILKRHGRGG